jgi:two-component system sensor histidine kinase BaeS
VLVRAVFFLGFVILMIVGMAVLIFQVVSNVGNLSGWWALGAIPFILILLAGRSFIRSWRPVRRLITAAGSLADGDYTARVEPTGSGSMRAAMGSFNAMASQLETADEQRRRLLADLGHEMRTPLTVVRGEIEAMLDGVHDVDAEHLGMLLNEVQVMERLLEDLRTLSLLDAGQLPLHREPTDPITLVEDVADGYRRRAAEAGVSVEVKSAGSAELMLDPVRIREVLTNLADNALRAMPDGGRLGFTVAATDAAASLTIADTGTGIAAEDLEHVFDRFHKGSTSRGSGLGLTISRDLIEAHGGTIAMTSEPDTGTTVRIELPGAA